MSKDKRYERIYSQLVDLFQKTSNPISRMSTVCSVLHHKMQSHFFWTGYYLLNDGELLVGPYQGQVACLLLKKNMGVCWAGINRGETIVVANVHDFEGHIACNPLSKSEIVIPLKNSENEIIGVLDVDSEILDFFDEIDVEWLEKINTLIYSIK